MSLLHIDNLHASVDGKNILKGVNLSIRRGEVHAIMGPNGSGKSTLAYLLAGKPGYKATQGTILFEGHDLLTLSPEKRARMGMFLSFQHPVEIPGVRLDQFMRAGFNSLRQHRGEPELDPLKFDRILKKNTGMVGLHQAMTKRFVNMDFSGGEKKKSELLQMSIMEPLLSILDEPDSGLDVDALRDVANCIKQLHTSENAVLLVTHYQRILNYVVPDQVHILVDGRIVRTGSKDLAHDVEANGYDKYEQTHTQNK